MNHKGFTFAEVIIAVAIGGIALLIIVPGFAQVLERSRHESVVRQLVSDLRDARARSVATGWEWRIRGYTAEASGTYANQYRVLGRQSTSVAWPAENVAPFASDTQQAKAWVDIGSRFPGVLLDGTDTDFEVTFDSRGTATGASTTFNPVQVLGKNDMSTSITVSVVGGIRAE